MEYSYLRLVRLERTAFLIVIDSWAGSCPLTEASHPEDRMNLKNVCTMLTHGIRDGQRTAVPEGPLCQMQQ